MPGHKKSTKTKKDMTKGKKRAVAKAASRAVVKGKSSERAGLSSGAALVAAARAAAFTDESPGRAFEHFRPIAEAVPAEGLFAFNGQPLIMRANILRALARMEPHLPEAAEKLPGARLREVLELPALVMALDFAVGRVPVAKLSAGDIEKMLAEGGPWRELMLTYLEIASHPLIGLLPRERVAAVRTGRGKIDTAQDFVMLPGLFAEFGGALAGKHPFPADRLDLLSTLGGALVQQLRPGAAVAEVPKRTAEAILRDRFAALVVERYDHLQVLATVVLGKRGADELLPALRSAVAVSTAAPKPEPAPVDGAPVATPG